MECFAKCGWRSPAVSEARTYVKNVLKVIRGKAVKDPALQTFHVGQVFSQPGGADPSEGYASTFEAQGFPFSQDFYGVIEPSYGRLVSSFPDESRIDSVGACVMVGVFLSCLSQLPQFEAHSIAFVLIDSICQCPMSAFHRANIM